MYWFCHNSRGIGSCVSGTPSFVGQSDSYHVSFPRFSWEPRRDENKTLVSTEGPFGCLFPYSNFFGFQEKFLRFGLPVSGCSVWPGGCTTGFYSGFPDGYISYSVGSNSFLSGRFSSEGIRFRNSFSSHLPVYQTSSGPRLPYFLEKFSDSMQVSYNRLESPSINLWCNRQAKRDSQKLVNLVIPEKSEKFPLTRPCSRGKISITARKFLFSATVLQ
jgi:hypothetical protein